MKHTMKLLAATAFTALASPAMAQTYEETCTNAVSQVDQAQEYLTRFEQVYAQNDGYPQISEQTANLLISGVQGMTVLSEQQKQVISTADRSEVLPAIEQALKDTIGGNIFLEVMFCEKPRSHAPSKP